MRRNQARFLLLFVTVALISAACQQGTNEIDIEAGSEPTETVATEEVDTEPIENEESETEPEGIPIHGDGDPADVPVDGCDRDAFSGQWQSPRAAGTEPLDPNDGIGDEGGVGVVAIELSDSEVQVLSADTIAVYESWYCTATEIIGVTWTGDEETIATINDDGTLSAGQWTLTKAE